MLQGSQGQRSWAMLLHIYIYMFIYLFIYLCRGKCNLSRPFCICLLSHSVQLEFSISVQPDFAAPLSLCKPQASHPSFKLLHVFHIK